MTHNSLVLGIVLVALIFTVIVAYVFKSKKSWIGSFLQNFCGSLFVFSGLVKAVDPLGTAFKMEQYFAEFETVFEETAMGFIAPLFPWLANMAIGFSVFMIVFEICIGIMLLLGTKKNIAAWAFFLVVAFFTALTGFTFLTGYVPPDANFFSFGQWVGYQESNMKVTDCGCFGDFLKLEPKVSFFKDVVLLFPAVYFLFRADKMHELFSPFVRNVSTAILTFMTLVYCLSNYVWDIPHIDFRPFKEGVSIRDKKQMEEEAVASVEVIGYTLKNKTTGEVVELPLADYLKQYADYPKEVWESDQIKTEPLVPATKISDFLIEDPKGNEVTSDILNHEGWSFMIVSYTMPSGIEQKTMTVMDTMFGIDTVWLDEEQTSFKEERVISSIDERQADINVYRWDRTYSEDWGQLGELFAKATDDDGRVFMIGGGASPEKLKAFRQDMSFSYPTYMADDILLKTIVRSNPGIVLMQDGQIVAKWHKHKVPDYSEIKDLYMND